MMKTYMRMLAEAGVLKDEARRLKADPQAAEAVLDVAHEIMANAYDVLAETGERGDRVWLLRPNASDAEIAAAAASILAEYGKQDQSTPPPASAQAESPNAAQQAIIDAAVAAALAAQSAPAPAPTPPAPPRTGSEAEIEAIVARIMSSDVLPSGDAEIDALVARIVASDQDEDEGDSEASEERGPTIGALRSYSLPVREEVQQRTPAEQAEADALVARINEA